MLVIEQKPIETDVFIVGGGPAGLAAALAARRKGLHAVVADCARPPIDKGCGEGLLPDGLAALNRLGVVVPGHAGLPFTGIRFVSNDAEAVAHFPSGCGLGIRRTRLHEILVEAADRAGALLRWGAKVEARPDGALLLDGALVLSRWIVGADGQKSRVRRWAGIHGSGNEQIRFGFRCHFEVTPWSDCVEVYWARGCQVFVTPVGRSEVCIALLTRDPKLRIETALSYCPKLQRRLAGARCKTLLRGALSVQGALSDVVNGKFILIGDASGSLDAVTGEGLCLSFRQAECLAEALGQNDLDLYRDGHRALRKVPSIMASLMLLMDRHAWVAQTTLRVFERFPAVFSACLARHVGGPAADGAVRDVSGFPLTVTASESSS